MIQLAVSHNPRSEQRGQIYQCVDNPDDENEREHCELRTERKLPHVPVVLLPRRLADIATPARQSTIHANRLPGLFVQGRHAHLLLLLANL